MDSSYSVEQPSRAYIDALRGPALLEFGTNWCGHCRAAQPAVNQALGECPDVRHIKVEDGSGRKLGRSYGITLWPTLIFLMDGKEVDRLVRPVADAPVREKLQRLTSGAA